MNRSSIVVFRIMLFLVLLMLILPVVIPNQQNPSTHVDQSECRTENILPQDSFLQSYTLHGSTLITSNADFVSQGFPGSGTAEDPYIIEGLNITTTGTCIHIRGTNAYFIIRDCLLTGESPHFLVLLSGVTNGVIRNNIISGSSRDGLSIEYSSNNTVVDNTISGNGVGVRIEYSSNTTVVNNIISGNNHGVVIYRSTSDTVVNNTISENATDGIDVHSCSDSVVVNNTISGNGHGVFLCAFDTILVNNTITGNSGYGVHIESTSDTVVNNTISGNSWYGVYLSVYSENCLIYLNVIADNDEGNAYDKGTGNHWNTTGMGNYWSDYSGTGVYHIPGSAGSIDYHPFVYSPEDIAGPVVVLLAIGAIGVVAAVVVVLIVVRYRRGT